MANLQLPTQTYYIPPMVILKNVIYQITNGKRFTGDKIRTIPMFEDEMKKVLRNNYLIMSYAKEWLDTNMYKISHFVYCTKYQNTSKDYMFSKEDSECKLNDLHSEFLKFLPHLKYIDARDAQHFWNYIINRIYENSLHNKNTV
jgi:hypothetical protein